MRWEEFDRPAAARAFRMIMSDQLPAEHRFKPQPSETAEVVRHTIEGGPVGEYEAIRRERIEPLHDRRLDGLPDNLEAAVGSRSRTTGTGEPPAAT